MLNNCQFIGNLGADPEVRSLNSGDKVANIRIACTDKWKDKNSGERKERTEWISISIFGPLAGIAEQYLKKGSKIFISGRMQTRKWQDKDGNDRYTTEVVVQGFGGQMIMLDSVGSSGGGGYQSGGTTVGSGASAPLDDLVDEIPF